MNNEENSGRMPKKRKSVKPQYILWWFNDSGKRVEYGPLYDKLSVKRHASSYKRRYGENKAGWEVYDDPHLRRRYRDDDDDDRRR